MSMMELSVCATIMESGKLCYLWECQWSLRGDECLLGTPTTCFCQEGIEIWYSSAEDRAGNPVCQGTGPRVLARPLWQGWEQWKGPFPQLRGGLLGQKVSVYCHRESDRKSMVPNLWSLRIGNNVEIFWVWGPDVQLQCFSTHKWMKPLKGS